MSASVELPVEKMRRPIQSSRAINKRAVASLAESIREVGIINPLTVRAIKVFDGGREIDGWEVIAGGHRFEAAREIGLETVPCIVVDLDDDHAELVAIDENLRRLESDPAERAILTKRRKVIYLKLHPETAHGGDRRSDQFGKFADLKTPTFAKNTSAATGKSESTVHRENERAEQIAEDLLHKVAGTALSTGTYLDALKKLPEDKQRARVERDLAREADIKAKKKAAKKRHSLTEEEALEQQVSRIMKVWHEISEDARTEFLARIKKPGFDSAEATITKQAIMDRRFG